MVVSLPWRALTYPFPEAETLTLVSDREPPGWGIRGRGVGDQNSRTCEDFNQPSTLQVAWP